MFSGRNGQFYLMAALVIIGVIVGFATVTNYISTKSKPSNVVDLSTELALEGAKVIDFGIYQGDSAQERNARMEDFAKQYSTFIGTDKKLLFIAGSGENLQAFEIRPVSSTSTCLETGSSCSGYTIEEIGIAHVNVNIEGKSIKVKFGEDTYTFDLTQGENFYFLISQQVQGENIVQS